MLTSRQDIESAAKALTLGAKEFVTKPFDADDIRAEVSQLLQAGWKSPDDPPWRHAL